MKDSLDQRLHLRPYNHGEDGTAYTCLTGGGTHPGWGMPVIFQAGRIGSKQRLEEMDVEPRWSKSSELRWKRT